MAKKKKKYNYKKKSKNVVDNKNTNETVSEVVEEKKLEPTVSKVSSNKSGSSVDDGMLFGRENFIMIGVAALLMVIGLFLMTGGHQDPNEWNADEVYSARRTIIAPMFILAALIVALLSIFKKRAVA